MSKEPNLELNFSSINQNVEKHVSKVKDTILNFVVPLVSSVVSVLVFLLVLMPSYRNLPQVNTELTQKNTLKSTLQSKLDNLKRLVDFKSVVDENSLLVGRVLVSEPLVPALLTQIDRIAKDSGMTVDRLNYSFGEESTQGGQYQYSTVTVSLSLTGTFSQLKTFMSNIEHTARLIDIDTFRYSVADNEALQELTVSFTLKSPYMKLETAAVTDDPVDLDITSDPFLKLINKLKALSFYDAQPVTVISEEPVEIYPELTITDAAPNTTTPTDTAGSIFGGL